MIATFQRIFLNYYSTCDHITKFFLDYTVDDAIIVFFSSIRYIFFYFFQYWRSVICKTRLLARILKLLFSLWRTRAKEDFKLVLIVKKTYIDEIALKCSTVESLELARDQNIRVSKLSRANVQRAEIFVRNI